MKIHRIEQRSDEWYALRLGKMTASRAQCIATNGVGLETYIYEILAEKFSNHKESYTNSDMQRGIELEEQARMTYEIEYYPVETVGFVEMDELVGCSPDGLVAENLRESMGAGGTEIKCPNDANYFRLLVQGEKAIKAEYIWQAQMCMMVTDRHWWDLVFYNPNFEKNMLVFTINRDIAKQEKLRVGIEKGKNLIREITEKYGN